MDHLAFLYSKRQISAIPADYRWCIHIAPNLEVKIFFGPSVGILLQTVMWGAGCQRAAQLTLRWVLRSSLGALKLPAGPHKARGSQACCLCLVLNWAASHQEPQSRNWYANLKADGGSLKKEAFIRRCLEIVYLIPHQVLTTVITFFPPCRLKWA